ncbi:hypothetical protein A2671_01540 [Candidatus Kaiserbacteria bacterium RIFCSPHIGHO2_01_FULL_49_13]|uniref:PsbP C-terminal domain-containing protein n=1 Tax=Candidatus Kaiserbacteria bacterium RIFCSPHIGHO2_01_FULL_49_13 TaxID=1798477 RepID=A0A1F6CD25_9BACT|nr:MAG: hypothetical protein A2671_01540 [Candidatus Kaiserbacteria bacterium RIFCSPHIGHO2_01_FULL_49_13]
MNQKTIIGGLLALVILGIGFYAFNDRTAGPGLKTYTSNAYKISFQYPGTYFVSEKDMSGSELRGHHVVMLMEDTAENRSLADGTYSGPPREGPPTINVDIFQNNLDNQSPENWVKNSSISNYKLSPDGLLSSTAVGGEQALRYTWSGLYNGVSYVAAHGDNMFMFSGTSLAPQDPITRDFEDVVRSVQFK